MSPRRVEVSLDERHVLPLSLAALVLLACVFGLGVLVGKNLAASAPAPAPVGDLAALDARNDAPVQKPPATRPAGDAQARKGADDDKAAADKATADKTAREKAAADKAAADKAATEQTAAEKARAAQSSQASAQQRADAQAAGQRAASEQAAREKAAAAQAAREKTARSQAAREKALAAAAAHREDSGNATTAGSADAAAGGADAQAAGGADAKAASGANSSAAREDDAGGSSSPGYTVQLAASQDKGEADRMLALAKGKGLARAYVLAVDLGDRGTWYRVRVGSFTEKAAAERYRKDVQRQMGRPALVMPAR